MPSLLQDCHHVYLGIHFLHCLAVSIDFGNTLIILRSWTKSQLQKRYPVVPKNVPVIILGAIVCAPAVCRSFPAHRFRQNPCSNLRHNMKFEPLFSRWAPLGRRTSAVSHSQHKTLHIFLLIQFCYGSCNPEIGASDMWRYGIQTEVGLMCGPSLSRDCGVVTCNNAVYKKGASHSLGPRIPRTGLLRPRVKPSSGRGRRAQNPPSA